MFQYKIGKKFEKFPKKTTLLNFVLKKNSSSTTVN